MRPGDFERLFETHAQPLFGFIAYRCGDRGLAEEFVAETFARAYSSRKRFDSRKASEKTWLYSIALNIVRDHARRSVTRDRALERVAVGAGLTGDDTIARAEQRLTLNEAIATLADVEREALALRFGADLSAPEIAKLIDEPLTTVEGRIYRSLRKLRERMGEADPS
jgi:RNA polymerase sigma-70 factor (ECF subfamily)